MDKLRGGRKFRAILERVGKRLAGPIDNLPQCIERISLNAFLPTGEGETTVFVPPFELHRTTVMGQYRRKVPECRIFIRKPIFQFRRQSFKPLIKQ
nr:hypothetical protein [Brockia lithotrophica]